MRQHGVVSERLRQPQPLLRRRIPSRRGALEQPNATSDDWGRLTIRFWLCLAVMGAVTGLLGVLMMLVLHTAQHIAYGYHDGLFGDAVERVSDSRRLLVLIAAGVLLGPAWYLLRRVRWPGSVDVDDAVWSRGGDVSLRRSLATGTLSEIGIGAGASLGREAAPKLLGGATASAVGRIAGLDAEQRHLLIACGAGAGLGCVYNVPLAGALLTAELLIGQLTLPVVLPALLASVTATVVSWPFLGHGATYPGVVVGQSGGDDLLVALALGPLMGLAAVGFVRLIAQVSHRQPRGRWLLVAPAVALAVLGLLAGPLPLLLGNGKDLARLSLAGADGLSVATLLALGVLKPLVTAMCLGSGLSGGLLTPVLSTGAALGAAAGAAAHSLWPGAPGTAVFVLLAASALTGAAMQAPLTGLVLIVELTRTATSLLAPIILATALATAVARYIDGYSIYSARLQPRNATHDLMN